MNRTVIPKLTFFLALLFLAIGLVKPVYAVFFAVDTDDAAVDGNWSMASPNPYMTDPSGDSTVGGASSDFLTGWVATDGGSTSDYLYIRTEVRATGTPGAAIRTGVRLDCDNDGAAYYPGDPEDRYLVYSHTSDLVAVYAITPGPTPQLGNASLVATPPPATDGEFIPGGTAGNYEWRIQKSVFQDPAIDCDRAANGDITLGYVGIVSRGIHDISDPELGPPWNTPTAVHLQNLTASPASTSISILFLVTGGFLLFVSITLRRRNRQALAFNKIQP